MTVVIQIRLETEEPPTGTVALEGRDTPTLPFVGWLGLLRVLSQMFSVQSERETPVTPKSRVDS